jgi:membrane-bound lytic murein transglycosylase D
MRQKLSHLICIPVAALSAWLLLAAPAFANLPDPSTGITSPDLPRPPEIEDAVQFWISIYSGVTTQGGLIHDSRELSVVYEQIKLTKGAGRRTREREVERAKGPYKTILRKLATGRRSNLSDEEARVLALWPKGTSNAEFRAASQRLRFQLGQADKFRAGVIRSGAWNAHIAKVFSDHGLPPELAALPHVESSFTPHAYSRVGAAGLWQFTRSTGRRFMQIDHVADERLDPYRATEAAAKLLRQNHDVTGAWPLAITAYNHGAAGMRRATRTLGTKDIHTIIRKYKGRTFGFASRNFYVEFLAALEVSSNYENYFGTLILDRPEDYDNFELAEFISADALVDALGISAADFKRDNPALRPAVWQGAKRVPRNFSLRMPRKAEERPIDERIASIGKKHRHASQTRDINYRVRRGDTLSTIARRFRVPLSELVAINNLRSQHRIRVGQVIKLPQDGARIAAAPRRCEPHKFAAAPAGTQQRRRQSV